MKNLLHLLTLQFFRVSGIRKLYLLARVLAFVVVLLAFFDPLVRSLVPVELLALALVAVTTNLALSTIQIIVISAYRRRQRLPTGETDNFILGVSALANLVMILILLGSVFPIYGIPVSAFLTSLSVFSVAIAWLFKEYLTNYFDSFRLMFSTDLRIGDYIKVSESTKGIITAITMRATKVKTDEGDVLLIPNTTLMNTEVTNYSQTKYKRVIVPFTIRTELLTDVGAFERHLTECARAVQPDVVNPAKVFLRLHTVENGKTSCAFELAVDQFSFQIEDVLQRAVLTGVIAWSTRSGA